MAQVSVPNVLLVRVASDGTFTFESPLGQPFLAEQCIAKPKREAALALFAQRYSLSAKLRRRIAWEVKLREARYSCVAWFLTGLLLPCFLGGATFDMDRDVDVVRAEVAQVLSTLFAPEEYKLGEHIMEGTFTEGRVLLRLFF